MVSSFLPAYQQFRSNKNTFLLSSLSKKKGPNFPAQRGACSKLSSPSLALPFHSPFHIMHFTRPRAPVQRASPLPSPSLPPPSKNAQCHLSRRVQPSRGVEHNNRSDAGFLRIPHSLQGEQALSLSLYHPSGWTMEFSNGTLAIFLLDVEGG